MLSPNPLPRPMNPPQLLKSKNLLTSVKPCVKNMMLYSITPHGLLYLFILHKTLSGVNGSSELNGTPTGPLLDIKHD